MAFVLEREVAELPAGTATGVAVEGSGWPLPTSAGRFFPRSQPHACIAGWPLSGMVSLRAGVTCPGMLRGQCDVTNAGEFWSKTRIAAWIAIIPVCGARTSSLLWIKGRKGTDFVGTGPVIA